MTANRGRRDRDRGRDRGERRGRRVEQPLDRGRLLEDLVPQPHVMSRWPADGGSSVPAKAIMSRATVT